jgi:hypothetical protein
VLVKRLLLLNAALLSLLAAGVTYVVGLWNGHLLDLRAESTYCTAKALNQVNPDGGSSYFPPSLKCRWSDGTTTELVPSYVNPLMFTLFAFGTALLLLVTVLFVRRMLTARSPDTAPPASSGTSPAPSAP